MKKHIFYDREWRFIKRRAITLGVSWIGKGEPWVIDEGYRTIFFEFPFFAIAFDWRLDK